MKSCLQDYDLETYSTYKEEKSVAAEGFLRTLKNKIYITSISKNMYIDKFADIVNEYNNIYQSTIKTKSVDVKLTLV